MFAFLTRCFGRKGLAVKGRKVGFAPPIGLRRAPWWAALAGVRTGGGSLPGRPPLAFVVSRPTAYQVPSLAVLASAVLALHVAAAGVEVRNVPAPVPGSTP